MTRESVVFGLSGAMFGLLAGWIIGSQQARPLPGAPPAAAAQAPASQTQPAAPVLDVQRANALEQQAKANPTDARVRAELANLYFDSEKFEFAIPWYEAALRLNPKDINISTDLAVCYYYADNPDKALKQIDQSLNIDPKHGKTLLNQGIIRAFGKQDLAGAQESWENVVKFAPNSPEAARAKQGLEGLKSAHQNAPAATPGAGGS